MISRRPTAAALRIAFYWVTMPIVGSSSLVDAATVRVLLSGRAGINDLFLVFIHDTFLLLLLKLSIVIGLEGLGCFKVI